MSGAPRLLILGCSRRKRDDAAPLPALERYDGGLFRIVRRYLRSPEAAPLEVLVLSARYGLIDASTPIEAYEQRMCAARARELADEVQASLRERLRDAHVTAVCVCLPRVYREALGDWSVSLPLYPSAVEVEGGRGGLAAGLHDWLYGHAPVSAQPRPHRPVLRGRQIDLTAEALLSAGRAAARTAPAPAMRATTWFVELDDRQVNPKWLVALASGLSKSGFGTDEARRVLGHLGIAVHRRYDSTGTTAKGVTEHSSGE